MHDSWKLPVARALIATILLLASSPTSSTGQASAAGPRIDLNQDTLRGDVRSTAGENWNVPAGGAAEFRTGDIAWRMEALKPDAPLGADWWKPGFDYPARMASDGVVCRGPVRLTLRGLPPGRHSLGSWHNRLDAEPATPIRIVTAGEQASVTPSRRVLDDDDAASAHVTFETRGDEPAWVEFHPAPDGIVVINGWELDRPDPRRRARMPSPTDGDEHAPENPVLRWRAAPGASAHGVFVGHDYDAVEQATRDSPEFQGETTQSEWPTSSLKLDHRRPVYWRVDERYGDERHGADVVRGLVWKLQVRRLAFVGAEGYGRFAIGGRGGRVFEVTNLDDSGPGSLRAAVEATGPRTVVFRVGGLISLQSKLLIRNPYLTIAGQTAPGDGICVKNFTCGCSDTHDIVIRHLRIRVGDESGTTQDGSGARGSDHVIFDHCSISWSIDEGFSSREARNLTVQRCLIAEALHQAGHEKYKGSGKGHAFAASISGNIGSFHHNLLAHCTGRNWSLAGGLDRTATRLAGRLDIRNNVVFNWRDRTTDGGVRELCFVDNLYLPGPATRVFSLLKPDAGDAGRGMRAFLSGNVIEGHSAIERDNWTAFVGSAEDQRMIRRDAPPWDAHVTRHAPERLLEEVLADVGATQPRRDAVDARIVADVRQRKSTFTGSRGQLPGIIDSQADAGGWPTYRSGAAPPDDDHDGLPTAWEVVRQLDPHDPADGSQWSADGRTFLEQYLEEVAAGR